MTPEKSIAAPEAGAPRITAVVEIGTTSIRMLVAEVGPDGRTRVLDSLQRAIMLGRDAFTQGCIEQETIEECVKVLRSFKRILDEYGVSGESAVTAVATSAIREASNRDAVLDRILMGTGFNIEVIDEAEVGRFTYLAVQPVLEAVPDLRRADTLVVEVGGGSTDVLALRRGKVGHAQMFRLGSFRLRQTLEEYRAPRVRIRDIMRSHVDRAVAQIIAAIAPLEAPEMLILGGDARFAAGRLLPDWDRKSAVKLAAPALARLAEELARVPADELVAQEHLSFAEAETLAPALLVYARMAELLQLKHVYVGEATLRDGILIENVLHGAWTDDFRRQIVSSAVEIGRKYLVDQRHADVVAGLAQQLFAALQDEHRLGPHYEVILTIAALLHESGNYISNRSHHKHSMYIIMNSDIFGLGLADLRLAALVARYHRRSLPKPTHEIYSALDRNGRMIVSKLAALLRIADALDRGGAQAGRKVDVAVEPGALVLNVPGAADLTLETHSLQEKGRLFEQVYGLRVILRGAEAG